MIKPVALLALVATPAFAQLPVEDYGAKTPAVPLVTYDIIGTFPANVPVTKMTAPNASFLLEITFPQTVPAYTFSTFVFDANAVSARTAPLRTAPRPG